MSELQLSTYQQNIMDAFDNTQDNLFISALAGTGKTFTLVELSKHITDKSKKAVFIAFNKSIQLELSDKITNPIFKTYTFNALGYCILLKNAELQKIKVSLDTYKTNHIVYNITKNHFTAYDFESKYEIINDLMTLWELCKVKDVDLSSIQGVKKVIAINNLFVGLNDLDEVYTVLLEIKQENMRLFEEEGIINFSDQIYITLHKLQSHEWFVPPYLKFDYIFGDEVQDWNRVQQLLSMYIRKPNCRIILVGDRNQAIYAFNGADGNSFDNLKRLYNTKELSLPINYRCPSSHLNYVNKQFKDIHILPRPKAPMGDIFYINYDEIAYFAQIGDFIISRKNSDLCQVSLDLLAQNKPIYIKDTDLVKKVLKLIERIKKSSMNLTDFKRNLKRTQKDYSDKLKKQTEKQIQEGTLDEEKLEKYNFSDGKVDVLNCVRILVNNFAERYGTKAKLEHFIPYVEQMLNTTKPKDCIICTSIHQAKGLEANNVFVLNNGRPFVELSRNNIQKQQENNLSYVALTRAKQHLYLVASKESEDLLDES